MGSIEDFDKEARIANREQSGRCRHCLGDISVRNPTGYCDHLYYPENCSTCEKRDESISYTTTNFKGKRHGR